MGQTTKPEENKFDYPLKPTANTKGNTNLMYSDGYVIRWFHSIYSFALKFVSVNRENMNDGISVHRVKGDPK
jgi:hypothetical protein